MVQGTSRTSFVVQTGNQFYYTLVWIGSETFTVFFSFWIGQLRFSLFEMWSTRNLLDPEVSTCVGGIEPWISARVVAVLFDGVSDVRLDFRHRLFKNGDSESCHTI